MYYVLIQSSKAPLGSADAVLYIKIFYRFCSASRDLIMLVKRLYAGSDPQYPYEYSIEFEHVGVQAMYAIADYVVQHKLGYWVGCLTGVIYVPTAKDVTFVQLLWQDL